MQWIEQHFVSKRSLAQNNVPKVTRNPVHNREIFNLRVVLCDWCITNVSKSTHEKQEWSKCGCVMCCHGPWARCRNPGWLENVMAVFVILISSDDTRWVYYSIYVTKSIPISHDLCWLSTNEKVTILYTCAVQYLNAPLCSWNTSVHYVVCSCLYSGRPRPPAWLAL